MAFESADDPNDWAAFEARWARHRQHPSMIARTIMVDARGAGCLARFEMLGEAEVGDWLGREFGGRGIGTQALTLFLREMTERPVFARVAKDNLASLRVLTKCGFTIIGENKDFAPRRGVETEEWILKLERPRDG